MSGRGVIILFAALVVGAAILCQATAQALPEPAFTEGHCGPIQLSPNVSPRVRCGTVAVPRDYERPGRGAYQLRVVVVASATQPARSDPDLYISGGPGGPLTVYADAQTKRPLGPNRDLILVDQRGTGASEPALCPGLDRDLVAAVAVDRESEVTRRAVFAACREQAVASGIDLADFGTSVTVEDFERVRKALGIARWNVFGVSYGTTVAMTMLARHPDTIRSAVLDSVNPPDPILPPWSLNVANAREAFFASCQREEACRSSFPDLAAVYRDVLKRLADRPPIIPFPHGMGRPDNRGPLTAALFAFVIGRLVYYPTFYPGLPRIVFAVHDGDPGPFTSVVSSLFAAESDRRTGSRLSLRAAVDCRDRPRFHGPPPPPSDTLADMTTLMGICNDWTSLGPPPLVPQGTDVPTLVLAGEFDPNARPADSRRVAEMIGPHATWVEFPGMGHSVRAFSPCGAGIVAAFIEDPDQALNTSCARQPPPIEYLPRKQAP